MLLANIIKDLLYTKPENSNALYPTGFNAGLLVDNDINLTVYLNKQPEIVQYAEINLYSEMFDNLDVENITQTCLYFEENKIGSNFGCIVFKLANFEDPKIKALIQEAISTKMLFGHKLGINVFIAIQFNGDLSTIPKTTLVYLMLLDGCLDLQPCSKANIISEIDHLNTLIDNAVNRRNMLSKTLSQQY
jgi:hypothetical protein